MRAVGATPTQVRRTVRWESVITALLGAVQGIVIGILLGWAVTLGAARPGPQHLQPARRRADRRARRSPSSSASSPRSSRPGGPRSTCCGPSPSSSEDAPPAPSSPSLASVGGRLLGHSPRQEARHQGRHGRPRAPPPPTSFARPARTAATGGDVASDLARAPSTSSSRSSPSRRCAAPVAEADRGRRADGDGLGGVAEEGVRACPPT